MWNAAVNAVANGVLGVVFPVAYEKERVAPIPSQRLDRFCAVYTGLEESTCGPEFKCSIVNSSVSCSEASVIAEQERFDRSANRVGDTVKSKLSQLSSYWAYLDFTGSKLLDQNALHDLIAPLSSYELVGLLELYTSFPGVMWTGVPVSGYHHPVWAKAKSRDPDMPEKLQQLYLSLNMMHITDQMFRSTDSEIEQFGDAIKSSLPLLHEYMYHLDDEDTKWLVGITLLHAPSLRSRSLIPIVEEMMHPEIPRGITTRDRRRTLETDRSYFTGGVQEEPISFLDYEDGPRWVDPDRVEDFVSKGIFSLFKKSSDRLIDVCMLSLVFVEMLNVDVRKLGIGIKPVPRCG